MRITKTKKRMIKQSVSGFGNLFKELKERKNITGYSSFIFIFDFHNNLQPAGQSLQDSTPPFTIAAAPKFG